MKRHHSKPAPKPQFSKSQGNSLQAEQLEDRVMFDAVPDAAALAAASEGAIAEDVPAHVQAAEQQEQQADVSRELVLINGNVQDAEQLLSEFFAENQNRSFEVQFLDPNSDGIQQITDLLNASTGEYDAIHVLSHGIDAEVQLGSTWLRAENLNQYAAQISAWSNSFTDNGDLLFYGCKLAESAEGQQLIESISTLTGADVAASTDLTGHVDLGGDWDLETEVGTVEATSLAASVWNGLLAAPTIDLNVVSAPSQPGVDGVITLDFGGSFSVTNDGQTEAVNGVGNGETATYANVGSINGWSVDMRAIVVSRTGPDVTLTTVGDIANVVVPGTLGVEDNAIVRWEVVISGTTTQVAGDFTVLITDLDQAPPKNRYERLVVSESELDAYTLNGTTDITATHSGGMVTFSPGDLDPGTPGVDPSNAVQLNFSGTSSFSITYIRSFGGAFTLDGDFASGFFANPTTVDTDSGYGGTFFEGGPAVAIAAESMTITDDGNIASASITLSNPQGFDQLNVPGTLPAGISIDAASTATNIILTGTASTAEYAAAIKAITFENTSATPNDTVVRVINVQVTDDSSATSNIATMLINVAVLPNTNPVAANDTYVVVPALATNIDPIGDNDTDVDFDTLTFAQIVDPNGGAPITYTIGNGVGETPVGTPITLASGTIVTVKADGTLDVVTPLTASGPESFSYTISDGNGGSDTALVSLDREVLLPILNLDPNNTTGGADDGNFNATFTELRGPVAVTANTMGDEPTILGGDTTLESMTLTVAGVEDGLYEVLMIAGTEVPLIVGGPYTVEVNGLNYDLNVASSGGDLVITIDPPGAAISAPLVDFQDLLGDITYENKIAEPTDGDRVFTITASNGIGVSTPVVSTISVPNLFMTLEAVSGDEDASGGIPLGITNAGATADFEIDLNNAPVGTTLSHGSDPDMDGIWTVDPADIQDVNILPPTHYSGDFDITITSGDEVEAIAVSLTPQADGLTLNLNDASGDEDTAIAIPFTTDGSSSRDVSLVDATDLDSDAGEDSPETLTQLQLSGIPVGAIISDGTNTFTATLGNAAVDVVAWDLSLLTITPPENLNGTITLTTTAISTEPDNNDTETSIGTFDVIVNPVNDAPVLSGVDATPSYTQNTAPVLLNDESLAIADADDTELLSATVTISNEDIANDLLTLNTAGTLAAVNAGITVTAYNPLTGELQLSGNATLAEYEAALEGLLFSSSSGVSGDRTVSMVVNDGEDPSNIGAVTVDFTPDTTPPATPGVTGISDDSGISATDGITNDNTPIITGTFDEADTDVLTVNVNGTVYTLDLGTPAYSDPELTSDGSGNWTLDLTSLAVPLPDGLTSVIATATDLAGNSAVDPTNNEFTIDTSTAEITPPTVTSLITNNQTPTLNGTWDEVDATTLTVNVNGATYVLDTDSELTTDSSGNWTLNLNGTPLLPENTYEVTVTSGDVAGNTVSDVTSDELEIDITDPATPTVNNLITNDVTPTLTGTWDEETASILQVTLNGFEYILDLNSPGTSDPQLTTDGDGNWTLELNGEPAIPPGNYNVQAKNFDAAGNVVSDLTAGELTIDVTAPVAATTPPDLTSLTDTGISDDDNLTNDTTPNFSGEGGEPGSTATIYATPTDEFGTPTGPPIAIGTGPVNGSGEYLVPNNDNNPLDDGTYDITVIFTDAAGNESDPSPVLEIKVDTTAPLDLEIDDADSDEIEGDHIVNLAESPDVSISGDGVEPTSTVAVTIEDENGHTLGPVDATVNPDGTWSIPDQDFSGLDDGPVTVTAVETDKAGNVGPDVVTTLQLDTTPPAQPPGTDMTSPTDSAGASDSDDLTNDTTPTFAAPPGTGVAGDTVTLYVDGSPVATGTVNPDGSYEITASSPLAEGPHDVTVSFTDPAGNEGPQSEVLPIIIDTIAPTAIAIDDADVEEIEGNHIVNLAEVEDVTISGDGVEPTSTVTVTISDDNGNDIGPVTATVNPDGTWTILDQDLSSLDDGPITVSVVETDAAGNVGNPVETTLEKDTIAPDAAVTAPNLTDESDSAGSSNEDNITNINTPTFDAPAGTGEPNSTVTLYVDGTPVGTATVNLDGSYEVSVDESLSLSDGPHEVTVTFTDPAGNEGAHSPLLEIEIDTTPPTDPAGTPNLTDETDSAGTSNEDDITNINTPTFNAPEETGIPGDMVTLYVDNIPVGTAIVNEDGSYEVTPVSPIEDGEHTVTVTFTDPAGNESESSSLLPIVVDTAAPKGLTLDAPIEEDNIANKVESPTVDFTGEGVEPTSIVEVTLTDSALSTLGPIAATVNPDGTWELLEVDITSLADGDITVSVSETDPAGNVSEPVTTVIEKDTVAPDDTANSLTPDLDAGSDSGPADDDDLTFNNVPTFTAGPGSAIPDDTVMVYVNGEPAGTGVVNPDGSFGVTVDEVLGDGEYEVTLTFTDPAGNESVPTASLPITIDTIPPNTEDIELIDVGPDFVEGTGEPGAIIHLLDEAGNPITDSEGNPVVAQVDEEGNWSIKDVSPQFSTGQVLTVVTTDAAGNVATAELKVEYFGFDSFNNAAKSNGTFDDISTNYSNDFFASREVLFSSMIRRFGSQPIVSGFAMPGTVLIGRVYSSDGTVLGEAHVTADGAGNWLMNFGNDIDADIPTIIIEHVATEAVPLGTNRFRLTETTYTQFGFGSSPSRHGSAPGAVGSLAGHQILREHHQNLNPLSILQ